MTAAKITGLILAGGLGSRMKNLDKGLQLLHGQPLIVQVLQRFAPQVDEVIVSANRNLRAYQQLGYPVYADGDNQFNGPLAGMLAGLTHAMHDLLAVVPCDAPSLSLDLVARLHHALEAEQGDAAIAWIHGKPQPTFCLMRSRLAKGLRTHLANGERKASHWFETIRAVKVNFDGEFGTFANINSLEELQVMESKTIRESAKV